MRDLHFCIYRRLNARIYYFALGKICNISAGVSHNRCVNISLSLSCIIQSQLYTDISRSGAIERTIDYIRVCIYYNLRVCTRLHTASQRQLSKRLFFRDRRPKKSSTHNCIRYDNSRIAKKKERNNNIITTHLSPSPIHTHIEGSESSKTRLLLFRHSSVQGSKRAYLTTSAVKKEQQQQLPSHRIRRWPSAAVTRPCVYIHTYILYYTLTA